MLKIRYNIETACLSGWTDIRAEFDSLEARECENIAFLDIVKPDADDYEYFIFDGFQLQPSGKVTEPLTPDELRLAEIVALSPSAITMPDMWEAIRILAKFHTIGGD